MTVYPEEAKHWASRAAAKKATAKLKKMFPCLMDPWSVKVGKKKVWVLGDESVREYIEERDYLRAIGKPVCKMTRREVYKVVDGERDYQTKKWGKNHDEGHDVPAWLCFVQHHLNRAIAEAATSKDMTAALSQVRKFTALGVSCMEVHGALSRQQEHAREEERERKLMSDDEPF